MIIVMKADASPEQIVKVAEQVETLGLKPHVIEGSERTVVAVVGAEKDATVSAMETVPGVARVLPILAPYKVASREVQQEQRGSWALYWWWYCGVAGVLLSHEQILNQLELYWPLVQRARGGALNQERAPTVFRA